MSDSTRKSGSLQTDAAVELHRRREILIRHIGHEVAIKRSMLRPAERAMADPFNGVLVNVKRLRASIRFGSPLSWDSATPPRDVFGVSGVWSVPIAWLLMPFSTEPAPKQLVLFAEVQK